MSDATSAIPGEAPRRPVAGFVLIAVGITCGLCLLSMLRLVKLEGTRAELAGNRRP